MKGKCTLTICNGHLASLFSWRRRLSRLSSLCYSFTLIVLSWERTVTVIVHAAAPLLLLTVELTTCTYTLSTAYAVVSLTLMATCYISGH